MLTEYFPVASIALTLYRLYNIDWTLCVLGPSRNDIRSRFPRREGTPMCTYDDFTWGHGIDDKLKELEAAIPGGLMEDDPVSLVAAAIMLDQLFGLHQEDDYVLVQPALIMWLMMMVTPVNPEIVKAIADEDDNTLTRLITETFEACFESPEGPEYTAQYPEIVRGKNVRLRVMTEAQAGQLTLLCTMRADGTFIYLPNKGQPRTLQDLEP